MKKASAVIQNMISFRERESPPRISPGRAQRFDLGGRRSVATCLEIFTPPTDRLHASAFGQAQTKPPHGVSYISSSTGIQRHGEKALFWLADLSGLSLFAADFF
jgi:hypothetical protein